MGEESLTLKVAEALQDEVGYGRGRLDTVTRNELGLSIGDIVEIHGRRRDPTVAIVWRARTEDEGKGIIRVDGLIRNNAKNFQIRYRNYKRERSSRQRNIRDFPLLSRLSINSDS